MKTALIAIATLILLAACATTPVERAPLPKVPVAQVTDVPQETQEMPVDGITAMAASEVRDGLFGTRLDGDKALAVSDVRCDVSDRTLSFTFRNTDTRAWRLDNDLPLAPPEGVVGIRLLVNQYAANTRTYVQDGARLFGPNERLSENCGNVMELAPGESTTCTLTNVPLYDIYRFGGVNKLVVNVPGAAEDPKADFLCHA